MGAGNDIITNGDSTTQPIVSVIVPAYNAAGLVRETLESVSAQTYQSLEIIVVDDGSSDTTCDVVEDCARRDPRIRLIRQTNAGVGAARNTGIAAAKGKYVAPIDADDIWHPDKILAQVTAMERWGDEAGFAYCWSRLINNKSQVTGYHPTCSVEGDVFNVLFFRNFTHNASVPLFRTAALQHVGGYATREQQGGVQGCEDWELCLRLAEKYKVCVATDYLVDYRVSGAGMSFNVSGMERSFQWMIRETVRRKPEISQRLIRWTTGHIYLYLALKARRSGQVKTALRCLKKGLESDFAVLLSPRFVSTLAQGLYRLMRPKTASTQPKMTGAYSSTLTSSLKDSFNRRVFWMLYLHIEHSRFDSLAERQAQ